MEPTKQPPAAMFQQQVKQPTKDDLGEMHPKEVKLIQALRSRFRFGELTITVRDGVPFQVVRYVEIERF